MCNELKCAIQSTVDLININKNRDVQGECANRLYRVLGLSRYHKNVLRYYTS